MKIIWALVLAAFVSGCVTTGVFDPRACPTIREYTKAEQKELAIEQKIAGPALRSALIEYGKLRDRARACAGKRVPR